MAGTGKDDKRVKYTKMFLKDALIELMKEKSIEQVSITELCNKADINRNTFYSHFNNVYDVLHMVEHELEEELLVNMSLQITNKKILYELFENIQKHGNTYRILLSVNGDKVFMWKLFEEIKQIVITEFSNQKIMLDDIKMEMLFEFLFFGSMSIVKRWLDSGTIQSPKAIADFVYSIASNCVEPLSKL